MNSNLTKSIFCEKDECATNECATNECATNECATNETPDCQDCQECEERLIDLNIDENKISDICTDGTCDLESGVCGVREFVEPLNADNPKVIAYNKYRNGITIGTKTSIDPAALSDHFVKIMNNYKVRTEIDLNMMSVPESHMNMYKDLLTKYFVPIYERGVTSRGPSYQLLRINRIADISRDDDGDGAWNWNSLVNQYEFNTWTYSGDREKIIIDEPALNYDGASIGFYKSDLSEHVRMTKISLPSGTVSWRMEYFIGKRQHIRMHFVEISF